MTTPLRSTFDLVFSVDLLDVHELFLCAGGIFHVIFVFIICVDWFFLLYIDGWFLKEL